MPTIRPISIDDIDDVLKIETASFSAPFTKRMFEGIVANQPPFEGFVIEDGGKLAGYMIYSRVLDEMELLTIAVDEKFRKNGFARKLINLMFENAGRAGICRIFLEVRPSNTAAQTLYKSVGFVACGLRKGYYADNKEDAIVMQKMF
jgi:ribosomal-protein-alanine N-acetyltransferase